MAIFVIDSDNPQHSTFQKGFNLRWPTGNIQGQSSQNGADNIYFCETVDDIILAAKQGLSIGSGRITVRSGGHCYEGFVSNKLGDETQLSIIDISMLTGMEYSTIADIGTTFPDTVEGVTPSKEKYRFRVSAGNQNWNNYTELYKKTGKTLPGGSCYSVGAGGHICGGGYGFLARKHGLTCDLLAGVDILVPNKTGQGLAKIHVTRHGINENGPVTDNEYLFLACCGGGGGQFGIITSYYFDELPTAPKEVLWTVLDWTHDQIKQEDFKTFLNAFYTWFSEHDVKPATWGLHTKLELRHRNTGPVSLGIHFIDINDEVVDTSMLQDFYTNVVSLLPDAKESYSAFPSLHIPNASSPKGRSIKTYADFEKSMRRMDWLTFTQNVNGSGENQKGRYKSAYQKGNKISFPSQAIDAIWNAITAEDLQNYQTQSVIQIQSYGGKINAASNAIKYNSASGQRDSVLKWQPQTYWRDTKSMTPQEISNLDEVHAAWIRGLYKAAFDGSISGQSEVGVPVNDYFDGCYINYPDLDMIYQKGNTDGKNILNPNWRNIYFPNGKESLLQDAKKRWDPLDIFRNSMSVKPKI